MIRELVSKFNKSLAERLVSSRKGYQAPIKLTFVPQTNTGRLKSPVEGLFIKGETIDISRTGIAFLVSSIRIKENYLVGQDRMLNAEIDLPGGKVRMQIIGRRYEKVGIHLSTEKFMIGAQIVKIDPQDQEIYEHFLRFGNKRKPAAGNLELGID